VHQRWTWPQEEEEEKGRHTWEIAGRLLWGMLLPEGGW